MDYIAAVVDRSGSMGLIREDAEGGLNEFLRNQQKEGKARLTLAEFDTEYSVVADCIKLKKFEGYKLVPRGGTALYDGIGRTAASVKDVKVKGKKFFVIVTDGGENASKEFTHGMVSKAVAELRANDWEVMFIGADEKSIAQAKSLGISGDTTFIFDKSKEGARDLYGAVNAYTSSMRGGMAKEAAVGNLNQTILSSSTLTKTTFVKKSQQVAPEGADQ